MDNILLHFSPIKIVFLKKRTLVALFFHARVLASTKAAGAVEARGGSEKPSKQRYCCSAALTTSSSLASLGGFRFLSIFAFFPPQNQQQFGAVVSQKWTEAEL